MRKLKYLLFVLGSFIVSCEDWLEEDARSFVSSSNYYDTDEQAISGVNAAYGSLRKEGVSLEFVYMDDVAADDLIPKLGQSSDRVAMDLQVYTAEHEYLYTIWKNQYEGINRANVVLSEVSVENITPSIARRLHAEAKFLRAFYYFRLVRWFGEVPIVIKASKSNDENVIFPIRNSINEVYAQIIEDLKFSESNLEDNYEYDDVNYYRATKGAAKSLLLKVYATMAGFPLYDISKWELAKEKAEEIIDNKMTYGYELVENISDIFDVNTEHLNTEQIWSLPGSTGLSVNGWYYTRMKRYFITWSSIVPTNEVLGTGAYQDISIWDDVNDKRRKVALGSKAGTGITDVDNSGFKVCSKYWDSEQDAYARNDYPYIRFSEIYYFLAEAIVETGGDLHKAMEIINMFRTRAGIANLPNTENIVEMRKIIHDEKRKEFLFEGKRRFDLIRWGEYVDTMISHGEKQFGAGDLNKLSHTAERNTLFPLPLKEFIANKNLRPQNYDY